MDLPQVLEAWPVVLLCTMLIVAAAIDFWKLKVPNWLTFPMILSGWISGLVMHGGEGLLASVVLSFFGLGLLLPLYAIGGMGAGDVKMQAGFGSWVGVIYGLSSGFWIVLYGFCLAAVIGGVIALGMMVWRGDFFQNRKNVTDIVRDWFTSKGVGDVAAKAAERKPRMHLLPYGVPLCIGFISYLVMRSYELVP
jgi:prepilin peptidase CpaA